MSRLSSPVTRETEMVSSIAFSLESFASRPRGREKPLCAFCMPWVCLKNNDDYDRPQNSSNKSHRIQNLLNWDYWEVNLRCNILNRHRFLGKVVAGKMKIKLREFLTGNDWTQIKHGGQRPVYTLLITMVKWVAKRTFESRLPGARKRGNKRHVFLVLPPVNVKFSREFSLCYPRSEKDIFTTLTVW